MFLTEPKVPTRKIKRTPFDFKEQVAVQLMRLDIPRQVAELAVIDFSFDVTKGYHDKQDPITVAQGLLGRVEELYHSMIERTRNKCMPR